MEDLLKIKEIINENKNITIISHVNPDGDALGSQLGLALGLKQLGIEVKLINKDPIPSTYQFLQDWELIKPMDESYIPDPVLICVDCATWDRLGYQQEQIIGENTIVINIDHHISNTNFGNLNWVGATASATAEIIYDLLGLLQVKIDKSIATALYTGISTDTGSFLYESTTAMTHLVVSDLINRGADMASLRTNYYENISFSKLELLRYGLNNLKFAAHNKIAWMSFDQEVITAANASDADAEGLINYIKNISGVELAIIFKETVTDNIKVSFRSKTWFDVNFLASHFGGGGHSRAAGCTINNSLAEATSLVIKEAIEGIADDRGA